MISIKQYQGSALSMVIAPLLIKINKDGKGLEDAAEFTIDLLIAADALTEIKMQVHGGGT